MKSLLLALLLSVYTFGAQGTQPAAPQSVPGEIKQLSWMLGNWTATLSAGATSMVIEEQWVIAGDGSLTGTATQVHDGKELARLNTVVVQKGATLHHSSLDERARRTEYTLTQIGPQSVTFESQTHGTLRYTLQTDGTMELHALGARPGAQPMTIAFRKK